MRCTGNVLLCSDVFFAGIYPRSGAIHLGCAALQLECLYAALGDHLSFTTICFNVLCSLARFVECYPTWGVTIYSACMLLLLDLRYSNPVHEYFTPDGCLCILYTFVLRNKLLVGDDQVCLGENVTAVDLSVLATYQDSV